MGITFVKAIVSNDAGTEEEVRFLVDSGASYTLLPLAVWQHLELKPDSIEEFSLADGTLLRRNRSECRIQWDQMVRHTPVILGEEGDEALLGVRTLEVLGLVLNPFNRPLHPMRMLLA